MGVITKVLANVFILILVYLFLTHSSSTKTIIDSIGTNSVKAVATLQGRSV